MAYSRLWRTRARGCALLIMLGLVVCPVVMRAQFLSSPLKSDEDLILFSATAPGDPQTTWTAPVHGWVFEREPNFRRLDAFKTFLRDRFGVPEFEFEGSQVFRSRAQLFLVDNERNKQLSVTVGQTPQRLRKSSADGHVQDSVTLPGNVGTSLTWIPVRAHTRADDARIIVGAVQLVDQSGISVVSDIDDTIKDSHVLNRRELAANTFLREFRAVPGMSELYRRWAANNDVAFHYVSGSPWQLYPFLSEFLERTQFPAGSFHLRMFRWKDRSSLEFLENRTMEYKLGVIDELMRRFTGRRFILVGDSGERDPDVYAQIAGRFPRQVSAILIRDVHPDGTQTNRFASLFAKLDTSIRVRIFRTSQALDDLILR